MIRTIIATATTDSHVTQTSLSAIDRSARTKHRILSSALLPEQLASVRTAHPPRLWRQKSAPDADFEPSARIPHNVQHQSETRSSPVRLGECPSATVFHGDPVLSPSGNRDNTKAQALPRSDRSAAAQHDAHVCHTAFLLPSALLGVSLLVGASRSLGVVARFLARACRCADRAAQSSGFASRSPFPGPRRFSLLP